jgi:hypothetical protein
VQFPSDGEWTWVVDQTPFATQQLGAITIVAAPAPAPEPAAIVQPALAPAASEQAWFGIGAAALIAGTVAMLLSGRLRLRPSSRASAVR